MQNKLNRNYLLQRQSLPLKAKIDMSKRRIREWVDKFGEDGVYVSFSGGKDSTVLLHLVREEYPNVKAVFVDTGLEYPEIREFAKTFDNLDILKPKKTFKQVINEYGYPLFSKENAQKISELRHTKSDKLKDTRLYGDSKGNGKLPESYHFMLTEDAPEVSHKCCNVMKKSPVKSYEHNTGKKPIIATMAAESRLRTTEWLQRGCNSFDGTRPISKPLSFWTEQDILLYLKFYSLNWCSVYGDIVDIDGNKISKEDININAFLWETPILHTTGCDRTGCMFCGFGCHLKGDERFVRLQQTHPKTYEYIMKSKELGGLGYQELIEWVNKNGNLNIKY